MGFKHPEMLQVFQFYPTKIIVSIYMEEIPAEFDAIGQESNTPAKRKIYRPERTRFPRKISQTLKKGPFQGIFSSLALFQNLGREFPESREKHASAPLAHQNTPFSVNNPTNSHHFAPPTIFLSTFCLLFFYFFNKSTNIIHT